MVENILWTEKYRPTSIADVIVPDRIKTTLQQGLQQNLLIHGTPGIGKTTTAKALCKTFNVDYIYINGSNETGVDTIRTKIIDFVSNQSLGLVTENTLKAVIIDEADMMSSSAYAALRATVEQYHSVARFILTCNYVEKIPEPIKSRFQLVDYNFSGDEALAVKKQYLHRVQHICLEECIDIDVKAAAKLIKLCFPDFRAIVSRLQQLHIEGKTSIQESDISEYDSISTELFKLATGPANSVENYKYILSNFSNNVDAGLQALGRDFCDWLIKEQPNQAQNLPILVITIAKYQSMLKSTIDPVITLLACVFEIQKIIQQ